MRKNEQQRTAIGVVPLFGRDEMNLVEFPFGPITAMGQKSFEVEHTAFDRKLKREVSKTLLITGSEAFGLPRPIDDQVLVGMKALTFENQFRSRRIEFSRYHLCQILGWSTDGRAYRRLEESFDRIAGTTLKFKDAWYDNGEKEWKSKTFHLIEEVELCSKDRMDRTRRKTGKSSHQLCSFVWNETIWKSFDDGFMKSLDMEMFRKVSKGRRREVPLRLYRILDKRFYHSTIVRFDLRKLCIGILGMSSGYCVSEMSRVLSRAASWLSACEYLSDMIIRPNPKTGVAEAVFYKRTKYKNRKQDSLSSQLQQPQSKLMSDYWKLPESKRTRLFDRAVSHCREHSPHLVEGLQRREGQSAGAKNSYLEMILVKYLNYQKDISVT